MQEVSIVMVDYRSGDSYDVWYIIDTFPGIEFCAVAKESDLRDRAAMEEILKTDIRRTIKQRKKDDEIRKIIQSISAAPFVFNLD